MTIVQEHYYTVAEAAELVRVSRSTLWRWISQGDLPAYRFGQRRVLIKRDDLDRLLTPAREETKGADLERERARLSRPLAAAERKQALGALEAAKRWSDQLLKAGDGASFPDSSEIVRQMR